MPGEAWDADGNGHGTHCAGTAVGKLAHTNGMRYGIADEAILYVGKVLSNAGSGSTSGIIDAIDWAIEKGCRVISMSLGSSVRKGEGPSASFERAGRRAIRNNCLLIAAAGNDSRRPGLIVPVSSPANAESIMAVGAVDEDMIVASFSNGGLNDNDGGRVDLVAPGVRVFSAYSLQSPGGKRYKELNGTSMATPHVAGIAAQYCEAYPDLTALEIWLKLEKNALALNHQLKRDVGQGLVQAL
ncbi:MAG: S8 family serine peptidase [Bacteroidota bacterium]